MIRPPKTDDEIKKWRDLVSTRLGIASISTDNFDGYFLTSDDNTIQKAFDTIDKKAFFRAEDGSLYNLSKSFDLDGLLTSGFAMGEDLVNKPSGSSSWIYVMCFKHNTDWIKQVAYNLNTDDNKMFQRSRHNGSWQSWVEMPSELGAVSHTTNGYTTLSNGTIFQWGVVSVTTDAAQTFNLPMTFPNACLSVTLTRKGADAGYPIAIDSWTTSTITIDRHDTMSGTVLVQFLAVGY